VTDNIYGLVIIIAKDDRNIAAVQFEIKLFDFFTSLNSSLIIFIRTYAVNYRNALDRLRVHMNIILFTINFCKVNDTLFFDTKATETLLHLTSVHCRPLLSHMADKKRICLAEVKAGHVHLCSN